MVCCNMITFHHRLLTLYSNYVILSINVRTQCIKTEKLNEGMGRKMF